MKRLHDKGIGRQGVQHGDVPTLDDVNDQGLECGQIRKACPGSCIVERLLDPLGWVDLRRAGRLEAQDHLRRARQVVGGMTATVLHQQHLARVGPCSRELVQKELEQHAVQRGHA